MSVRMDQDNDEIEISQLGKGQYFGELALVTHRPRAASVYATGGVVKLACKSINSLSGNPFSASLPASYFNASYFVFIFCLFVYALILALIFALVLCFMLFCVPFCCVVRNVCVILCV